MSFSHFSFLSKTLGFHTNVYIILPDDTGQGEGLYKTLYLLHGGGGNGLDWIRNSMIERYARENRIAVVMPEVDGSCFYADMRYGYPYFSYLSKELPLVMETMFPITHNPQNRYVAGFSMGGYGAFKWAFHCPEFFASAANLSGISFLSELFDPVIGYAKEEELKKDGVVRLSWGSFEEFIGSKDDSKTWIDEASSQNSRLPRLFAAIGKQDMGYSFAQNYLSYAKNKGIQIHYEEMDGGHDWDVWDTMVKHFIQWSVNK